MKRDPEKEFEKLDKLYYKKFGRCYGISVCDDRPTEIHNARMREAIKTGKPAEFECLEGVLDALDCAKEGK